MDSVGFLPIIYVCGIYLAIHGKKHEKAIKFNQISVRFYYQVKF
jgi:hypothetical protein